MITKKKISASIVTVVVAAAAVWWFMRTDSGGGVTYRFATVERATLEATVSATGTLNAVTTVQVGTQVSGLVTAIHADFNQNVKKGQLLARIDPTLLEQQVRDAKATLARNTAEVTQAQSDYDRAVQLFQQQVLTQTEFDASSYRLAVALANMTSAQVGFDRAEKNLSYASIYAPIDGVVIERNVDVGQTVAASLSAPQLFLIANDLTQMEILASVDESDIGVIHEGQVARFTVQPYPNEKFVGRVRQVRLQSTITENVVTYTAVVSVENSTGELLPGMTATVDFITGSADSALVVPNAALRFRPTTEQLAALATAGPDSSRTSGRGTGGASAGTSGTGTRLYYLNDQGKMAAIQVETGLTNGTQTVVEGPSLRAGMQVITSVSTSSSSSATSNPFQSTSQQSSGGPPGRGN